MLTWLGEGTSKEHAQPPFSCCSSKRAESQHSFGGAVIGRNSRFCWEELAHIEQQKGLRPERPFTGVSGPSGPEIPKKSRKESFWGSAKKSPKTPEKVEKYPKKSKFLYFRVFFDFFGYFRGLFCRPAKRLFSRLFWDFGPGGPGDSCKWSLGSQRKATRSGLQARQDKTVISGHRRCQFTYNGCQNHFDSLHSKVVLHVCLFACICACVACRCGSLAICVCVCMCLYVCHHACVSRVSQCVCVCVCLYLCVCFVCVGGFGKSTDRGNQSSVSSCSCR